MSWKEQEILDKIKEKTDPIETPDSLRPETVRQRLAGRKSRNARRWMKATLPAAACLVLAAGIYIYVNRGTLEETIVRDWAPESLTEEISQSKTIASAESYQQIYEYLEEAREKQEIVRERAMEESADLGADRVESSTSSSMSSSSSGSTFDSASGTASSYAGEYSETNLRHQGVDEGDIVKTDGTFLYILGNTGAEVSIVETGEDLRKTGVIQAEEDRYIEEIYVLPQEKKLVLICSRNTRDGYSIFPLAAEEREQTEVLTYDVSEPSAPELLGTLAQSGRYHSSRLADGYLYLFSQYDVGTEIQARKPETFIPLVGEELLSETEIFMPPYQSGNMYEVITAMDLEEPDKTKDSKAIFTKGGELYVSGNSIYYYETQWEPDSSTEVTTIRKLSYDSGRLTPGSQGIINGYINDSFSIDEYEGNLRIVTTVGDTNSVYVLDRELEELGKIEGLAEDERIYSARFMGDIGYFVTFRETDPLFSVDFSIPEEPKILGQLKIPGFSEYLHFYGEGKLLGIGMDVDEETQITGGVKLTMFDISDPTDVKEADTYILENVYNTEVSYEYKAALIDPEKNWIGFPADSQGGQNYYLFTYDENNGFQCKLEEEINGGGGGARGVYIGETLYVVQGNVIEAYSLESYEKTGDLIL